jgi:hypothetical protein
MITRQEWYHLSDDEKFDYLFRHADATERASAALAATVQSLQDRLAKIDAARQGNAS